MRNPQRNLADDAIRPIVYMLEKSGVPGGVVADVLFDYLMLELVPKGDVESRAVVAYLAHLKRLHAVLQERIETIQGSVDSHRI